jgi:hypothetical protein
VLIGIASIVLALLALTGRASWTVVVGGGVAILCIVLVRSVGETARLVVSARDQPKPRGDRERRRAMEARRLERERRLFEQDQPERRAA